MANLRKDTDFDWLDRIGFKCGDKVDVEVFIWDPEMPTPENLEYDFFEYWSRKRRTVNTPSGRVCRARNRVADHIEDAVSSMKSGLVPTHGWWRREVHRYKSPTEFKVRKKETREASFYEVKAIISTKHALKPYCKWADSVASAAADSVSAVHDRAKQLAETGNAGVIVCIENTFDNGYTSRWIYKVDSDGDMLVQKPWGNQARAMFKTMDDLLADFERYMGYGFTITA